MTTELTLGDHEMCRLVRQLGRVENTVETGKEHTCWGMNTLELEGYTQ